MDENYDPAHKTSSIASNGTVPSLYSGTSTIADFDETFEGKPFIALILYLVDLTQLLIQLQASPFLHLKMIMIT